MQLDSLYEYVLLSGLVGNGSVPNDTRPKLYLYDALAAEHAGEDLFALLMVHPAGFSNNEDLPNYHKGMLQIVVTSRYYDVGYSLAKSLSERMHVNGLDLEDMYIYRCVPRHLPISYRRNEQGLLEFSVNFDTTVRLK